MIDPDIDIVFSIVEGKHERFRRKGIYIHVHLLIVLLHLYHSRTIEMNHLSHSSFQIILTFVLHYLFFIKGDDLHTSIPISKKQARQGTTLTIEPIIQSSEKEDPILLTI